MASSEVEIANLVYRDAECIDAGDFPAAADLFAHAGRRSRAGRGPGHLAGEHHPLRGRNAAHQARHHQPESGSMR